MFLLCLSHLGPRLGLVMPNPHLLQGPFRPLLVLSQLHRLLLERDQSRVVCLGCLLRLQTDVQGRGRARATRDMLCLLLCRSAVAVVAKVLCIVNFRSSVCSLWHSVFFLEREQRGLEYSRRLPAEISVE